MSHPFAPPTRGECGTARAPEGSILRVASVVRRRRDVTAGAPSSGSRVRLCSLHHVTPADGAPRWCMTACVACFFPDHRLSISGFIRAGTLGAGALVLPVHACSDGETSTPHLAHGAGGACRTAPIRWWRRCAKARLLGTRTL